MQAKSAQADANSAYQEFRRTFLFTSRTSLLFLTVLSRADGSYYVRPGIDDALTLEGLQFSAPDVQQAVVKLFSASDLLHGNDAVAVDPAVLLTHAGLDGAALSGKQPAFKSTTISHLGEMVWIRLARNPNTVTCKMLIADKLDFGMCCERATGSTPKPAVRYLIGVVVHVGSSIDGGHYYDFIRHGDGEWYCESASQSDVMC